MCPPLVDGNPCDLGPRGLNWLVIPYDRNALVSQQVFDQVAPGRRAWQPLIHDARRHLASVPEPRLDVVPDLARVSGNIPPNRGSLHPVPVCRFYLNNRNEWRLGLGVNIDPTGAPARRPDSQLQRHPAFS
jgi:hypothetical protein